MLDVALADERSQPRASRAGAARGRRSDDEPARRRAQRPRHPRRRRSARRAAVAGARLCAAGPMGQGARHVQDRGGRDGHAADRTAARRAQGRNALGHRGRRFRRRRPTTSTISETIGMPHDMEPALSVLMGRLAEGTRPPRGCARRLSHRGGIPGTGPPRRKAGCARPCCATSSAISSATRSSSELESLTTIWRGDDTEIEALQGAGAILHRRGPLPRLVLRHAQRDGGASGPPT